MKRLYIAALLVLPLVLAAGQQAPLSVSIVSPPEGGRLQQGVEVEVVVSTSADVEVEQVELFINDILIGKTTRAPYVFVLNDLAANSVYRLRAVATSAEGQTAVDSRVFRQFQADGISVRVDLVTLYVAVNDASGNYIRNLNADDFIIEEDGVRQEIAAFSSEQTPLTAAILMDISSSMIGNRIVRSQNAAIDLVNRIIGDSDKAMVLGFDDRLITYQAFTSDVEKLAEAIRLTGPNGGTALYDAVAGTVRKLFPLRGKRTIILLSDGDDTDSEFRDDQVLNYLQKSSVIVYSVGLQTLTAAQTEQSETRRTIENLREMAEFSGGRSYFPSYINELPGIYQAIGRDLNSQYTISYYSTNSRRDGSWREIKVLVAGRGDLTLRHRGGYYAQ